MKGGGKTTWLVLIALAVGAWVGFKVVTLSFEHRRIEAAVGGLAERAFVAGSHSIEKEVAKEMLVYGVELDPETVKLEITPERDKVTLDFAYRRILDFGVVRRGYPFHVHVERYPKKGGGAGSAGNAIEQSIERSNQNGAGRYQESFQNP